MRATSRPRSYSPVASIISSCETCLYDAGTPVMVLQVLIQSFQLQKVPAAIYAFPGGSWLTAYVKLPMSPTGSKCGTTRSGAVVKAVWMLPSGSYCTKGEMQSATHCNNTDVTLRPPCKGTRLTFPKYEWGRMLKLVKKYPV